MTRCDSARRRFVARALCLSIALAAGSAQAQQVQAGRVFPLTALRGTIVFGTPPDLLLNGNPARLAPGVRIHGTDNLLLMSGALPGTQGIVNYRLEDATGLLMEIWLLTPAEIARVPWPTSRQEAAAWTYDAAAQAWYRP